MMKNGYIGKRRDAVIELAVLCDGPFSLRIVIIVKSNNTTENPLMIMS